MKLVMMVILCIQICTAKFYYRYCRIILIPALYHTDNIWEKTDFKYKYNLTIIDQKIINETYTNCINRLGML